MTNLLRFSRTAMTVVGKVSSHIVESLFVFLICKRLGEVIRATKDVGEEHLQYGDVALSCLEGFGKWVSGEDAETL